MSNYKADMMDSFEYTAAVKHNEYVRLTGSSSSFESLAGAARSPIFQTATATSGAEGERPREVLRLASLTDSKTATVSTAGPGSGSYKEIDYSYRRTPLWMEEAMPAESPDGGPRPTITLTDIGIIPSQRLDENIHGRFRPWSSLKAMEIVFLLFATSAVLVVMGGGAWWLYYSTGRRVSYICVTILNAGFCLYYTIHGIKKERPLEMCILVISCLILLIYVTIIGSELGLSQIAVLICILYTWVVGPIIIIFACYYGKDYYDSRHLVFRTIGMNIELQDAVFAAFSALAMIAFDLQLSLSTILFLARDHMPAVYIVLLVGGIILVILVTILAYFTIKSEEKRLFYLYLVFSPLQPAYNVYTLYLSVTQQDDFSLAVVSIVCGCVAILVRFALIINLYKTYKNFGKGVKQRVFAEKGRALPSLMPDWKLSYNTFFNK